jgi:class 3 adenylate cyclase/Tfp pilus assembly protein PilF
MNFRKTLFIFISLCFLLGIELQAQSDSIALRIIDVLDVDPNDSIALHKLDSVVGSLYYEDSDYAMKLALKEYDYAKKSGNKLYLGKAQLSIGIIYDIKGDFDAALKSYKEALEWSQNNKLKKLEGDTYNNFSITHAILGNMEESTSCALKALAIFEELNDSIRMARIYNNLGSRYAEMSYTDEALDYYLKAAAINKNLKDDKKLAFNYGNIGLLYYDLYEHEKSLEFFKQSINLQDTLNDKYNFSIALHNLGLVYQRLQQFDEALYYEEKALELAKIVNDEIGKVTILNGIAAIYRDNKKERLALDYFKQSAEIAEKLGARYYLINIYGNMADLYAKFNDYENAFIFNQKFSSLKDSIMSTEKDKAVQKVKEYESDKKQQEIQILTKDSQIQKLNAKRQKTIRNSIALVGVLILFIAIGLLHRFLYVRKTRNELSEKNKIINIEKDRSDELLLNILPAETAEELKNNGRSEARHFDLVTVMFTDFKGFTYMAEKLSPQELVDEIDHCFRKFDEIIGKHNIEKIKTIGDAYMCAGGLPVANNTNPYDVVEAAIEIQQFMHQLKLEKEKQKKPFFELRLGIHTGPVIAGIVGTKKFQYDIWGDTVNLAARMESSGEVGEVNISQTTYNLVKSKYNCKHRGRVEAKNKGAIDMYFVKGIHP